MSFLPISALAIFPSILEPFLSNLDS